MGTEIQEKGNNEETKKQEPTAIEIVGISDGKVQFKNLLEAGDSTYGQQDETTTDSRQPSNVNRESIEVQHDIQ